MLGVIRMTVAALGTLALSFVHRGSVIDMPLVFLALSALSLIVLTAYLMGNGRSRLNAASAG